jgi:integrase
MMINYETKTAEVMSLLEQAGYHKETIADHRRCYDGLQMYLASTGRPSSMEAAIEWLESRRSNWTYGTYLRYRYALFRLENYSLHGNIACGSCRGLEDFACKRKLTDTYGVLLDEYRVALSAKYAESIIERNIADSNDFLAFLLEQGFASPSEMSIGQVIGYWQRLCGMQHSNCKKKRYVSAVAELLAYLAERSDIPRCYSSVFPRTGNFVRLPSIMPDAGGKTFQPSKAFESLAAEFLSSLDGQRYSLSSKKRCGNDFTSYFMFIEANQINHSAWSVEQWLEHSPKSSRWEHRRHTLAMFANYLATGSTVKESLFTWQLLQIDSLPDWSRSITLGFMAERQREGLAQATLKLCRLASCRFFKFLDSKNVCDPQGITPELVKEFHNTDKHSTPAGKNTYGIKVRQLLTYMAERELVPQSLFLAVSTQCAPCQSIANVMSAEMESAVYQYRATATTPFELRNAAMAMLGLRMGIRASDIVGLKINEFDWKKLTVSFVQKKTRKAITLPVPIDVGNSVYKYIMEGRPHSGINGDGFVFIQHRAPFCGMKTIQACRYALKEIMSAFGLELPPGQGFHITRKTFATRLLTSKNSIDDISNALGHAQPETTEGYLARDEEGMRLCPMPFESVGAV